MAEGQTEDSGGGGGPIIIDGLLCCILRALSRNASPSELTGVVEREVSEAEVKCSWVKLFTHFSDVMDPTRKKCIINIDRESTRGRISDIISQLGKIDRADDVSHLLVMPWNYVIRGFESDSEVRSRIWEEEKTKDYDIRLDSLEKKMDKKHSELLSAIQNMLGESRKSQVTFTGQGGGHPSAPLSYAGVAAPQVQSSGEYTPLGRGIHPVHPQIKVTQGHQRNGGQVSIGRGALSGRSRSPSIKRRRNEDGSPSDTSVTAQSSRKAVVGTSNSIITGRKMRSPPADIFVWGVHPDTTLDDIVNDLAASGIKIATTDILKKSKDEAYLCSYKISIPADDLKKALNPEIWPLRVKVREFIHYKRNPQRKQQQQQYHGPHGDPVQGQVHHGVAPMPHGQHLQVPGAQSGLVTGQAQHVGVTGSHTQFFQNQSQQLYPDLRNMYSVLGDPRAPNPNL